jgi:hypothetical protein
VVLSDLHARYPEGIVVHGDCPDGDRQVAEIWSGLGGTCEPWPADWRVFGRSAGPRRNALMVKSMPDLVVAFVRDRSPGAEGCLALAIREGLTVEVHRDDLYHGGDAA